MGALIGKCGIGGTLQKAVHTSLLLLMLWFDHYPVFVCHLGKGQLYDLLLC